MAEGSKCSRRVKHFGFVLKATWKFFRRKIKVKKKNNYVNTYKFQTLTPASDVDLGIYKDALNYAFSESKIRNIAVSGPYSAGKSSVIETYKIKYPERKFIHLSLATFDSTDDKEKNTSNLVLEGKIINQLIHQISADDIPKTLFKVKKDISKCSVIRWAIGCSLGFVLLLQLFFSLEWKYFVLGLNDSWYKVILELFTGSGWYLISGFMLLVAASYSLYRLIKAQKTQNIIKKINLQGSEIEIFDDSSDSYFDRYLNEVIYLFKKSKADAVVFEDIDRFDKISIFERLKEINTLLNNHLGVINKKPIRFFYLLRDDLFTSKDRTKFFDYIVPIIPIVDGSNSYELLDKLFDKNIEDRAFLRGISLYIDDYRVLKNIYNEYMVYFEKLKIIGLNANKMLAIVTYKNIFPHDFSQLQLGRGYVFNILGYKNEIINNDRATIKTKIDELSKRINDVDYEYLNSSLELEMLREYFPLKRRTKSQYESGYYDLQSEIDKKEKYFSDNYKKRALILKDKDDLKSLNKELNRMEFDLLSLENKKISDLITNENFELVFKQNSFFKDFKDILNNDYFSLLVYLIRNGYIDESYKDYMAIVHENSLSRKDRIFIHSVMDRKGEDNDLELDNPNNILGLLTEDMFYQEEILNFTLIKYMMKNRNKNERMLSALVLQLKENNKVKFVFDFWFANGKSDNVNVVFSRLLSKYWPSILIELINNRTFESNINDYYDLTKIFLDGCHIDNLSIANEDNKLSIFISKCPDYLRESSYKTNGLVDKLELINVKFISIDSDVSDFDLLEKVYNNSMYEINLDNLYQMVGLFYYSEMKIISYDKFIKNSYSVIKGVSASPVYNYIFNNIEEYLKIIINSDIKEIFDDEKDVVEIANFDMDIEVKKKYLSMIKNRIKNILSIEDVELWSDLFTDLVVGCNLHNLVEYHSKILKEGKLDDTLIYYINKTPLDDFDINKNYKSDYVRKFLNKFIESDNIDNEPYRKVLSETGWHYKKGFNKKGLSIDKMKILIDTNCIRMNLENLNFLRSDEHYKNSVINDFIIHNIEEYIELFDDSSSFRNELAELLKGEEIGEAKIKLLEKSKGTYSIAGNYLTNTEKQYILENNFDINDIEYMVSHYDDLAEIKDGILSILVNNENELQKYIDSTNYNLMKDIAEDNFSVQTKAFAFSKTANKLNKNELKNVLAVLSPIINEALSQKDADIVIEDNQLTEAILNYLVDQGTIENYISVEGHLKMQFKQPESKRSEAPDNKTP